MRVNVPLSLLALLVTSVAFAGCLGDEDPADGVAPIGVTNESEDILPDAIVDDGSGKFDDAHAGHLPHVHDYWNGRERVILFDEPRSLEIMSDSTFMNVFFYRQTQLGGTFLMLPEGATVFEGTGKMMITASWTDPTITGLALRYKDAASRDFEAPIPLASGETLEIEVTPEMADMAHQQFSRWAFLLAAHGGTVGVAEGTVQLTIEIAKVRDIMVLPGHPATYTESDEYFILDAAGHTKSRNFPGMIVAFATDTWTDDSVAPNKDIVPMGTKAILAEVLVTGTSNNPVTELGGVDLVYRTAQSWYRSSRAQLIESDEASGRYLFGIYVDDNMVDGPYETESMWRFMAYPREELETAAGSNNCRWLCGGMELQYEIKATAYNYDPTDGMLVPPER